MESGDWIIHAFANDKLPKHIQALWEPMLWCACHLELIPKIMGRVQQTDQEYRELKKFLYLEHRFELLVTMCYAEQYHTIGGTAQSKKTVDEAEPVQGDNRRFETLSRYQLLSFLQWCDETDFHVICEKDPPLEIYRLCFLSLAIGYKKLALLFMGMLDQEKLAAGAAAFNRYGVMQKRLRQKWICDFYNKQPEGRQKNKLAARIVRYGTVLLSTPLKNSGESTPAHETT